MMRKMLIAFVLISLWGIASVGTASVEPQTTAPMAYVTVPVDLRNLDQGSMFGTLNLTTGEFTRIGTTEFLIGIARAGNNIYGIDARTNLVVINPATARTQVVGNTGVTTRPGPFGLVANVFSSMNDRLYLMDYDNNLFSVNPATGHASLVGATGIRPLQELYLATTLAGDGASLYYTVHEVSRTNLKVITPPTLFRINPVTAEAAKVRSTPAFVFGSVFARNTLYGFTRETRSTITGKTTAHMIITLPTTSPLADSAVVASKPVELNTTEEMGEHPIMSGTEY